MTSGPSVRRIQVEGRHLVAKSATGARRAQLRREAELCTCLEEAGVVRMVALRESDDRTDLVTEATGDHDLSSCESLDPTTLRRALTTAVAAVERLHEFGWTHGAICAEHLVVDRAGTSTLCSLGSARPLDGAAASEDAEQLRRVILHVLDRPPGGWDIDERARWRRWARSVRRSIDSATGAATDGAVDIASLRAALVAADERMHRRRLPDAHRARTVATTGLAIALVLGVTATALRQSDVAATRSPTENRYAMAADDPGVDDLTEDEAGCDPPGPRTPWTLDMDGDGCADEIEIDQNLVRVDGSTFRVGDPGDDLSLGDWDCDGLPTVLLLRPGSGEVFHFSWAGHNRPTTGELLAVVHGATSLSSEVDADGCDEASVQRTVGSAVAVPIEPDASQRSAPDQPTATGPMLGSTDSTGSPDISNTDDPSTDSPDTPSTEPQLDGGAP